MRYRGGDRGSIIRTILYIRFINTFRNAGETNLKIQQLILQIYFTTTTKQVIQFIQTILVVTDV